MRIPFISGLGISLLLLTGCSLTPTAPPSTYTGATITGKVHGGQQPVTGAQLYLFAAATTGSGQPSVSLLTSVPGQTTFDTSVGPTNGDYYTTSDASGNFTITGDYTCTAGQQVYLYALGGNPGLSASNPSAGLLAVLGDCPGPSFSSSTVVIIDEVTTIAAAYSMAGFATDALHVSSANTTFALQSIGTAYANAANLAILSTGTAQLSLVANSLTYGTAPQKTVDTVADILASCITGAVTGPTNPTSSTRSGNGWIINQSFAVSEFSPSGSPISTTVGYGSAFLNTSSSTGIAVDGSGDVWIANTDGNDVVELIGASAPTLTPIATNIQSSVFERFALTASRSA